MDVLQESSQQTGLSLESLNKIEELILKKGNLAPERVRNGIYHFCCKIGMVRYYFKTTPIETIANHIESILAAEIIAINRGRDELDVDFVSEQENSAMYLVNDDHEKAVEIERRMEKTFPDYRLQSYRTPGIDLHSHFRSYFVEKPVYEYPNSSPFENDINKVAAKQFLEQMDAIVPWQRLLSAIEPHYPQAPRGRRREALNTMLRVHVLQHLFNYSDPAMASSFRKPPSLSKY